MKNIFKMNKTQLPKVRKIVAVKSWKGPLELECKENGNALFFSENYVFTWIIIF
jgi:hypothetical protein